MKPEYIVWKNTVTAWERGGACRNTADVQIVAGPDGEMLRPVVHRIRGDLSNGSHAKFEGHALLILRLLTGRDEEEEIEAVLVSPEGEVEIPMDDPRLSGMIAAAREKAACYHCRSVVYAKI